MRPFFVISRYKEDVSWLKDYTLSNYLIYNKGDNDIDNFQSFYWHVIDRPNFGGNQYDICYFIYNHYERLPELMCFLQGNPFDHCNEEKFKALIKNTDFTAIESYEHLPDIDWHHKAEDGGYMEINNGWYINAHNEKLIEDGIEISCKFTFETFMSYLFENYESLDWIRFTPASQYLVTKEQCLQYSRGFWKKLMDVFPTTIGINGGTEAHIVERALWHIFKGTYRERI